MEGALSHNWASRLRRFLAARRGGEESCELCAAPVRDGHDHLLERATRRIFCACPACVLALGESARFSLISPTNEALSGFRMEDTQWNALQIPIDIVFLFHSSPDQRVVAIYPGPAGPTESQLGLETWAQLVAANPMLTGLKPDVEALLVNRAKGAREYYRVSIDRCYSLIGLIRSNWHGLSGGEEVWDAISSFFDRLRQTPQTGLGDLVHG
jgi:hypothetical protein